MRGIVLGGFMGVGKTTVGRHLARRTGLPFVDSDEVLAQRFGPIPDQFARDGEAAFRDRERALLRSLVDGVPRVVATGGGAWIDPQTRRALVGAGRRVVLSAPLAWLRPRLLGDTGRPLADGALAARYRSRQAAYRDADLVIEVAGVSVEAIVARILAVR